MWAAKFAAHHPNVVVLDLSSLQVRPRRADLRPHRPHHLEQSATPYSALHDIDANKPGGSIKIRVKTYAHSAEAAQGAARGRGASKHELDRTAIDEEAPRAAASSRQTQLAERRAARTPALDAQIAELAREGRAPTSRSRRRSDAERAEAGSMQLKKKTATAADRPAQPINSQTNDR